MLLWRRLVVCIVLGPLVGGVTILNGFGLSEAVASGDSDPLLQTLAITVDSPAVWFFGYLFGLVPAIVTGFAVTLLAPRFARRRDRLLLGAVAGGVASTVLVGWLALTGMTPGVGPLRGVLLIAAGGAVSGLLCTAVAELLGAAARPARVVP